MSNFKPTTDISDLSNKTLKDLFASDAPSREVVEFEQPKETSDIDDDFEKVRTNISDIIEKGSGVLDDMINLARASDHPRAFEVAGTLINTLINANKDLLEIHEKKKKIAGKVQEPTSGSVTNNNVFVGSTKDLKDFLNNRKNNE